MNEPIRGRGAQQQVANRFESVHTSVDESAEPNERPPTEFLSDQSRSIVSENKSPDIPFRYSINPYRGCEHGCSYCFARPSHTYLGHSAGLDFERLIYAKRDAASLLKNELCSARYVCEPIAIGVNTDAYQPLEKQLKITRQLLEVMVEARHPVYLITKSTLIERDLDLLIRLASDELVTVAVSVTTLDNQLSHRLEPRASAPHRRLGIIRTLSDAGIPVRVSVSPIIPTLNEQEIDNIISASAQAGATAATAIVLRLPHELADLFAEWLDTHYPLRKERVLKAIRSLRAGKLNDSDFSTRFSGEGPRASIIRQRFLQACKRYGIDSTRATFRLNTELFQPNALQIDKQTDKKTDKQQLSLFD